MGEPAGTRRVAIVTGASSGIGAATAVQLAKTGHDIGITFRSNRVGAAATAATARSLGARAAVAALDLAQPSDAGAVISDLADQLGGVDVLVNNAGQNRRVAGLDETVDGWFETLAVDLVGPWACARAAAERMITAGSGGRIVNVSSVLAFAPLEGAAAYSAAKAALEASTKVLALEWARYGVTVNAVAPGHTATPMAYPADWLDAFAYPRPVIPVGRAATANEIASAIAYLASPAASYVTGASLLVDGGLLLASGPQQLEDAAGVPPVPEPWA